MTSEIPPKKPAASRAWIVAAIVLVLGFDLAFLWQRRAAAPVSELGGHPDEATHYVTGLAVQNYLAQNLSRGPKSSFAGFAAHYPIVRDAAWPPLFPLAQAGWTSAFGKSRMSVLLMMCLFAAIVAVMLHAALREEFGEATGVVAAGIFLSLPLTREHYALLMPGMLCAAWMFAAMLAFARLIERDRIADGLRFGLFTALAILTDRAGLALVLFLPIALALSGKTRVFAAPAFWAGIALAAGLAGPLAWHFRGGDLPGASLRFTREAIPFYAAQLAAALGVILLLVKVPSLIVKICRPAERTALWSAAAALLVSTVLFVILVPAELEPGRLLPALPVAVMFAAAGCAVLGKKYARSTGFILLIAGVLTIALAETLMGTWRSKKWSGFRPLAEVVLESGERPDARILICSDRTGEGMFISEMAMGESRPARNIQSADTIFANTRFGDDEDLANLLSSQRFDYIVFDESNPNLDRAPLHDSLRRVLRDYSDRFWEMSAAPVVRDAIPQASYARLYRLMRTTD